VKYAIIILAAGMSKRLGQTKQLLPFKESTMLNNVISECNKVKNAKVYTVLGHDFEIIKESVTEDCIILFNQNYESGLGNTMAFASTALEKENFDALIFVLCDQIYFVSSYVEALISKFESANCDIIISRYSDSQGPPSLFSTKYIKDLKLLSEDEGARSIVEANLQSLCFINFPKGNIDIDTNEDLAKMF
jgi:molybdenum cofactor cytidylyltransferase